MSRCVVAFVFSVIACQALAKEICEWDRTGKKPVLRCSEPSTKGVVKVPGGDPGKSKDEAQDVQAPSDLKQGQDLKAKALRQSIR